MRGAFPFGTLKVEDDGILGGAGEGWCKSNGKGKGQCRGPSLRSRMTAKTINGICGDGRADRLVGNDSIAISGF